MNVQYKEEIPASTMVIIILALTVLIIGGAGAISFIKGAMQDPLSTKVTAVIAFAVMVIVLFAFRKLTIIVTDQQIIFGFSKFRKKFGLAHIESVELGEYKFSNYMGYGIRFGRDKTIGYVPCGGRGVKIKFKDQKRAFFIISNSPESLKAVLDRYAK